VDLCHPKGKEVHNFKSNDSSRTTVSVLHGHDLTVMKVMKNCKVATELACQTKSLTLLNSQSGRHMSL